MFNADAIELLLFGARFTVFASGVEVRLFSYSARFDMFVTAFGGGAVYLLLFVRGLLVLLRLT